MLSNLPNYNLAVLLSLLNLNSVVLLNPLWGIGPNHNSADKNICRITIRWTCSLLNHNSADK